MSDMEPEKELDQMLARSFGPPHAPAAAPESIEPSSGFVSEVMQRVREEAARTAAPSPIRFPWRRAIPGICMVVLAVAVCATLLVVACSTAVQLASHALVSATAGSQSTAANWADTAVRLHLGWLIVGALIAFVPFPLTGSGQRS